MAVCEMWDVKGNLNSPINYVNNPEKTFHNKDFQALNDVMKYTSNENKTGIAEKEFLVSAINCNLEIARDTMIATKKFYNDKKEIVAFHGFQSFKPNEVSPEIVHKIGVELAEKLWGERFEVVVATHLNTDCFHNHFVINATSFKDGKRFYDNKESLRRMRKLSDELCRQYELSVIQNPQEKKVPYNLYKANLEGKPTKINIAKEIIDQAIARSFTKDDFFKELKNVGCKFDFRENIKYPTITLQGFPKAIRLKRLGEEYSKENIFKKIEENSYSVKFEPIQPERKFINPNKKVRYTIFTMKKRSGLKGLYLHYCYRLGILPKKTFQINNAKMHYLLRDDLQKLDRITAQTKLLFYQKIDTKEQLFLYKEKITTELEGLISQRKKLYNSLRYLNDDEKVLIKSETKEISKRIKTIREEVMLCDEIILRSESLESDLLQVENDEKIITSKDVATKESRKI